MTGNSEQFSLRWNNFHSNITSEFQSLFQREDLVDVTLATDGKYIQAHKLVLSVCSPYFKELFKVNPCKHPIVILKDVSNKELTAILQFMYRGEVNVKQEELASFLKTAEMLQVKGLTGEDSPSSSPSHHEPLSRKVPITPNTVPMSEIPITESESPGIRPAKRSRTSTLHSSPAHSLPSVQSPSSIIIPVPSKSPSINSDNSRDVEFMDIRPKDEPLDYDEDFGEINVTPNIKSTSDHLMHILGGESSHSNQDTSAGSGMFSPISGLQDSNITQDGGQVGDPILVCSLCYKSVRKSSLKRHMDLCHTTVQQTPCFVCKKLFKNEKSLQTHLNHIHKVFKTQRRTVNYYT